MALEGKEFEVLADEIQEEVKKLGDNVAASQEEAQKLHTELKTLIDEGSKDYVTQEKIEKLTMDIATRQDEADKKAQEDKAAQAEAEAKLHSRLDDIEVAFKRPGGGSGEVDEKAMAEAKDFQIAALSISPNGKGANYAHVKDMEIDPEMVANYKKSFEAYIRTRDNNITAEELKALQVGIDPDGGYLVNPAMGSRIITKLFETDPMRQLASVESISTDAIEWLTDINEAGAEWETETAVTTDDTTPDWKKKRIQVHHLATRPKISQQMLEDSSINIENWLGGKVGDKFSRTEAAAFVSGDGIGKPMGFLSHDSGTSWGQIEQVNMGNATALTADGFVDVKYSLIEQYLERGTWLMNRTTLRDAMKLKDGNGAYIWKPGMIASDPSSSILNLPVRMSTTMPAVAANALSVALADWGESYMIVDRLGITVLRDPYTAKPFVEFYYRKRVGGDVINYTSIKIGKIAA